MINVAFLMDPLDSLNLKKDSTLAMIKEAQLRKYNVYYFTLDDLVIRQGAPYAKFAKLRLKGGFLENLDGQSRNATNWYELADPEEQPLEMMQVIMMRKDPPFNMEYISNTYLLSQLQNPVLINDPSEVRNFPEKHIMMNFPELTPPTLISSHIPSILAFIRLHKEVILKPAYGNGGIGIEKIKINQSNMRKFLTKYISKFQNNPVIIQKFLKNFNKGDKRIILVNGQVKGAVLRVPKKNSIKANFHAGGTAVKTTLSPREKQICSTIKSFLKTKKLFFVGIDVIDGYLTEINITSPTGIQEINRLNKVNIEKDVIDFVEKSLQ